MLQFGAFRLDTANECLWRADERIPLAPRPFAVLRYLVEHPARLITHDELLDALWPDTFVQPQVLRTYMLELRRTLGDSAEAPRFIRTHAKRGYMFVADVRFSDTNGTGDSSHENGFAAADATQASPTAPPLIGREKDLRQLEALARSAEKSDRQTVFLTGEPGIGKTALLDAFCRDFTGAGRWIRGRGQCVEGLRGRDENYPILEALGQLCASAHAEDVCSILGKMAPSWSAALGIAPPEIARPGQSPEAAGSARQELPIAELCAALEDLAKKTPVMLIFEDLHWGDDSSLHLLSALARRRTPGRLLVLATCRGPEKDGRHPLRALKNDLILHHLAAEVALGPLTQSATIELIARELKQKELPRDLGSFVHQRSRGNPLFALAIAEHLISERYLVRTGKDGSTRWELRTPAAEIETSIPAGLAQTIEIEIERLSGAEQEVLEAGSLMGISFPVWAVAAALEQDLWTTEEACAKLARDVYFIEHAGTDDLPDGTRSEFYVFVHDLYREELARRQPVARRAARHGRIAKRLSELFAGRESCVAREIAMHDEAARAGRAIPQLVKRA